MIITEVRIEKGPKCIASPSQSDSIKVSAKCPQEEMPRSHCSSVCSLISRLGINPEMDTELFRNNRGEGVLSDVEHVG